MSNPALWKPQENSKQQALMTQFAHHLSLHQKFNHPTPFDNYQDLYQWSILNRSLFWQAVLDFFKVKLTKKGDLVLDDSKGMFMAQWFADSQLNFAENLLRYRDQHVAIQFFNETGQQQTFTYAQLYQQVAFLSRAFKQSGIQPGDRIAAVLPNCPHAVIGMLACTSIGAIWSSCSPDFGAQSLLDRLKPIQPKLLLCTEGYYYKGKSFYCLDKISTLSKQLPSLQQCIVIHYLDDKLKLPTNSSHITTYHDFIDDYKSATEIQFTPLPFNHPVYILFSSGTTGAPKCIVHGAGGTLLQHLKELGLHVNLQRHEKIFYYTSTGWMMWNWLVSGLALGATLILYDGNPCYPETDSLLKQVAEKNIHIFGCSAKYISNLQHQKIDCRDLLDSSHLRTLLSTGSPLSDDSFDYVYQHIKKDVQLCSISGGTDIISCFALGNPLQPIHRGELQGYGLGMAMAVLNDQGQPVIEEKGELVCTQAFPSMPVCFWQDPDNQHYHQAYFEKFNAIWTHGDYAKLTQNQGLIIYGRSDTTLNPGGIRIGTAEIYRQLESIDDISNAIAVGQHWQHDQRIILFVQLKADKHLDEPLKQKIKQHLKTQASPHHVPAKIIQVDDIPITFNGKLAEKAVTQTIHHQPVNNKAALMNPDSLTCFTHIQELQ